MIDYKTEMFHASVDVKEYIETCVDVEKFLGFCKKCQNYDQSWSCPSFDFDPMSCWKMYSTMLIFGQKLTMPKELLGKTYTSEEYLKIMDQTLWIEKKHLGETLLQMENKYPGSMSLSAGSCQLCGTSNCTRPKGKPCRFPDRMRYSIEALGGDVGLTVTKYLGQKLVWIEEGKLPEYFILVCALLIP